MPDPDPLPARLSDLLERALADSDRLDRERYEPDPATWHRAPAPGRAGDPCRVCAAGMIMAGLLRDPSRDATPLDPALAPFGPPLDSLGPTTLDRLTALDRLARGLWTALPIYLGRGSAEDYLRIALAADIAHMPCGWPAWDAWAAALRERLIPALREAGL